MAEKRKTQKEVILEHLRKYGSITSMEAIEKYHITRLAAVIFELREMDFHIESQEIKDASTNYSRSTKPVRYIYHPSFYDGPNKAD